MHNPRVKLYPPHFDSPITQAEAEKLASDPVLVARHPFYPFLERNQHWTKFPKKGIKSGEAKDRAIKYAARRDSYIFSYYRALLNPSYERELERLGLTQCVLAYRHIPVDRGKGGKCNIHHADHAFKVIRSLGNCIAIALDIHHFFENLDHEHIQEMWWQLLGKPHPLRRGLLLPEDHFHVFEAVTRYSYIVRDEAYKKLGHISEEQSIGGWKQWKFAVGREDFPVQICWPKTFREELAGMIEHNPNPFGIPQGSPISDLLANAYMLDFDLEMNTFVSSLGGNYFRYSDDILIIMPGHSGCWQDTVSATEDILKRTAPSLKTKAEKTQVHLYYPIDGGPNQECRLLAPPGGADGLEYLGFRYDGKRIFLRNSTVSGFQRKITAVARRMARHHVEHHPLMSVEQLINTFNYNVLISKFGRVKGFDFPGSEYTLWTFWTYIRRSSRILGELSVTLVRQVNGYKAFARRKAKGAIESYYKR
jgi:hypothetical protein